MARAYSMDLRPRVVEAIDEGLSTREAARRFSIGIAIASAWHWLWRRTRDVRPARQGKPSGSKLDAHQDFILGLVEELKDMSLAEVAECLTQERGLTVCPATVWYFFDRRGITCKTRRHMPASSSARM